MQVDNFIYDSNMQIERGRLLADIIGSRKTVVFTTSIPFFECPSYLSLSLKLIVSQILQHLQSQATEKMEKLTASMQRDSLNVRIIAFLTFVYLPGTFVSVSSHSRLPKKPRLMQSEDILQHRHREISRSKFRQCEWFRRKLSIILCHRAEPLATGHSTSNLSDMHHCRHLALERESQNKESKRRAPNDWN